jgi:hypothetical protein
VPHRKNNTSVPQDAYKDLKKVLCLYFYDEDYGPVYTVVYNEGIGAQNKNVHYAIVVHP